MLVLSRKQNERIRIGEDIVVTIVRCGHSQTVRVGIDAPRELRIRREEDAPEGPAQGEAAA